MCVYIYVYLYMHIYIYIYTYNPEALTDPYTRYFWGITNV
jgi:hypothetical protein